MFDAVVRHIAGFRWRECDQGWDYICNMAKVDVLPRCPVAGWLPFCSPEEVWTIRLDSIMMQPSIA